MTKKAMTELRLSSYKPPTEGKQCGSCQHFWDPWGTHLTGNCMAVEIRGVVERFQCHRFGVCDLWEGKPSV